MGKAVDYAYENGVIIVAASDNNISPHAMYPAKYFRTICAGGIEPDGTIWRTHFEEVRDFIDIFAPADEIFRADSRRIGDRVEPGDYSENGDGTSYAAACTAGAAALWLAHREDDIQKAYDDEPWMTVEAFRTLLKQTASSLTKPRSGIDTGILDIKRLLEAPLPNPGTLEKEGRLAAKQKF